MVLPPASIRLAKPCHDAFIGSHHQPTRPSVVIHCRYESTPKTIAPAATSAEAATAKAARAFHCRRHASHGTTSSRNSLKLAHAPSHAPADVQRPPRQARQASVNGSISTKVSSQVTATVVNAADAIVNAPHNQKRGHEKRTPSSPTMSTTDAIAHVRLRPTHAASAAP